MSLDKAIEHGKEHRKQYRKDKLIFASCRNNGSCTWCRNSRLHSSNKRIEKSIEDLKEYKTNE